MPSTHTLSSLASYWERGPEESFDITSPVLSRRAVCSFDKILSTQSTHSLMQYQSGSEGPVSVTDQEARKIDGEMGGTHCKPLTFTSFVSIAATG